MDNIFEIKFSFEQYVKDNVILKFSNKQGGAYNVFSYHWQCFVWAAVIGFLHNERRPLQSPIADRPFNLNTMYHSGGEKDAEIPCHAPSATTNIRQQRNRNHRQPSSMDGQCHRPRGTYLRHRRDGLHQQRQYAAQTARPTSL